MKLPLNYWFIYGGWGVPALGGEGCGWATVIVHCYQAIAMALGEAERPDLYTRVVRDTAREGATLDPASGP